MAYDKVVDSAELDAGLTSIADAIRAKAGTSGKLEFPYAMKTAIEGITSTPTIEALTITENGTYTAPSGVDGYSPVTVNVGGGDFTFTYSGSFIDNRDAEGKGDVTFNTSGTLVISGKNTKVSVYLLAGGGGGAANGKSSTKADGGGGGYITLSDYLLAEGSYEIVIGSGGAYQAGNQSDYLYGLAGGDTTAFGVSVTGGKGGGASGYGSSYYVHGEAGQPNAVGGSYPNGGSGNAQSAGGDGLVRLTFS